VKRIINTSPATHKLVRQEYSVFLDWVYYHEVLSEFTVRHWIVPYEGCGFAPIARSPRAIEGSDSKVSGSISHFLQHHLTLRQVGDSIGCPIDVLELVAYTCRRAIVSNPSEVDHGNDAMERAEVLEQNISKAAGDYGAGIHVEYAAPIDRNIMVSNLHRVASLIYADRAVHRVSGTEFRHRRLVREGILLLTKMRTCQNAWPLFIIACEAFDDSQRLAILDVFEKSRQDRKRRSNHIHFIQHLVEAVWNQHDLNAENEIDYLTIFDAVVGSVPFIPLFA
jgi:hypothetical protein